jgi:hypothetical protein
LLQGQLSALPFLPCPVLDNLKDLVGGTFVASEFSAAPDQAQDCFEEIQW